MLRLFFLLLISSASLFLSAQNQPPFRVVFWNIKSFFDTRRDSLKNDRGFLPHSFRHWGYSQYRKKIDNVARTLTAVGEWGFPVLIGLCEVEDGAIMRGLTLYSPLREADYCYMMTHSSDQRGIDVALLYQRDRFKLLTCSSIPVGNFENRRPTGDILHVSGLLLTGDALDVLMTHLPSHSGGARQSEPYCLFTTQRLENVTDSLVCVRRSAKLITMGDFNDYPTDKSIKQVLKTLSPEGNPDHKQLYHLLARRAENRNFGSYKYQGEWGLLDHLTVSGTLLDTSSTLFTKEKKVSVLRLPLLLIKDEEYGGIQSFRTYIGVKYQGGYSGHLPAYTDFETNQSECWYTFSSNLGTIARK